MRVFTKNDAEYKKYYDDMVNKAQQMDIKKIIDWDKRAYQQAQDNAGKYAK